MKSRNLILMSLLMIASVTLRAELTVNSLRTDYKPNPIGIDTPQPKLSWVIQSDQMNTMQDSYEIRAAMSLKDLRRGNNLLWTTGLVSSSQSIHVKYGGPPLSSSQRVYWQIRSRDNHGKKSDWSEPAFWEMGMMKDTDWEADWITPDWQEDVSKSMPSPYLRKEFTLGEGIRAARLYISSHGLYQVEINGKRIGDQEFTPGWTSYSTRLQYQTYDVAKELKPGKNVIGIILGDGWFRGKLDKKRNNYGSQLSTIAELHVRYTGSENEIIQTDESWKASIGPIIESDIYNGEIYNASKELIGWSRQGFDDSGWKGTKRINISHEKLIAPEGPPVRIINKLKPLSIEKVGDDWLVDMGQNMVGWIRIKAKGKKGDVITLRHAEV